MTALGLSALKTALPATIMLAPAAAASSMVDGLSPPSTSMLRSGKDSRSVRTLSRGVTTGRGVQGRTFVGWKTVQSKPRDRGPHLGHHIVHKLLSTKAGLDSHNQNLVHLVPKRHDILDVGLRLDDNAHLRRRVEKRGMEGK